jgi:hypothetical protein
MVTLHHNLSARFGGAGEPFTPHGEYSPLRKMENGDWKPLYSEKWKMVTGNHYTRGGV